MLDILGILIKYNSGIDLTHKNLSHIKNNLKATVSLKRLYHCGVGEEYLINTRHIAVVPTSTFYSNNRLFDSTLSRDNRL